MKTLGERLLPLLVIAAIALLVLATAWTAIENRRTVTRNNDILQAMVRATMALEASIQDRAAVQIVTTAESEHQHDTQINQLRRGQRCIIYANLFPTIAWTETAIQLCLREGILPKGIP